VHFLPEGICDKEKCKVAEKILFVSPLETATGRRILGTKEKQFTPTAHKIHLFPLSIDSKCKFCYRKKFIQQDNLVPRAFPLKSSGNEVDNKSGGAIFDQPRRWKVTKLYNNM